VAGNEHFMFLEEAQWAQWATPTLAIPVSDVNIKPDQPLMIPSETGGGRGRRAGGKGELSVAGKLTTSLYPEGVPRLLATMFAMRAKSSLGAGFKSKLLIDDEKDIVSVSMQKRYRGDVAESIRGAVLDSFVIEAKTKEFVKLTLNYVAKDAALNGGTWADGTPAPAVVEPVPYPATFWHAYRFYEGEIQLGGTVALSGGELVVSGATSKSTFDNVNLEVKNTVGKEGFGINLGDPTIQSADLGKRDVTIKYDPNFDREHGTFYQDWRDGADGVVALYFEAADFDTGHPHRMKFVLPLVRTAEAPLPDLNAAYGLKRFTVTQEGFTEPTTGHDIGLTVDALDDLTLHAWS
jgi:Phage tail tube protein